jgi:hypothetical protein
MGLFDAFSADSGQQYARQGYKAQKKGFNQAEGFIGTGKDESLTALNQGKTEGLGYLDTGATQAAPYLQQATEPWQQLSQSGQQGIDFYGQLLGLNGGDPQAALQNIPGYQFAQEQGLDALNRTANSRGMLASGNNTQDILKFSQGLADQNYFNYLNAAQPYFGLGQAGAQGLSNAYTNQAGLYDRLGANKSNVTTGTAGQIADVNTNAAGNLANIATGRGQAGYQYAADRNAAEQTANSNLWGAILGGVGGLASAYGA